MQISHERRFIFFSNPKTGSTSMRALLKPYAEQPVEGVALINRSPATTLNVHDRPRDVRQYFDAHERDFNSYFKFTFVRNPWARLSSLYAFMGIAAFKLPPFLTWLKDALPDEPRVLSNSSPLEELLTRCARPFKDFACDDEGRVLVDRVVRLEDVGLDLSSVLERLGVSAPMPRMNVTNRQPYQSSYDAAAVERVARFYEDDIVRFGYEFGR